MAFFGLYKRCLQLGRGLSAPRERRTTLQAVRYQFVRNQSLTPAHQSAIDSARSLLAYISPPVRKPHTVKGRSHQYNVPPSLILDQLRTLASVVKPTEFLLLQLLGKARYKKDKQFALQLWSEALQLGVTPRRFIFSALWKMVADGASHQEVVGLCEDWKCAVFSEEQKPAISAHQFLTALERHNDCTKIHEVMEFLVSREKADFQFLSAYVQTCRRLKDGSQATKVWECAKKLSSTSLPIPENLIGSLSALAAETGNLQVTRGIRDFLFRPGNLRIVSGTIYGNLTIGLTVHNLLDEGTELLKQIQVHKIPCGGHPYTLLLTLAGRLANLHYGEKIFKAYLDSGLHDVQCETAAIDMYGKCGEPEKAREIFRALCERYGNSGLDITAWTAYMFALALNGRAVETVKAFEELTSSGISPNQLSVTAVLLACSHGGLVHKARQIWSKYSEFKDEAMLNCMVDVLARSGHLEEAEDLLTQSGMPNLVGFKAILGACRTLSDIDRAERIAYQLIAQYPQDGSIYVLLSNIYDTCNKPEKRLHIRNLQKSNCAVKIPGISSIEIDGQLHSFVASDTSHPMYPAIRAKLQEVKDKLVADGHVFDTSWCTSQGALTEAEKIDALCQHSEKLALCLGLLLTPPHAPLRITKNLRVCGDCHAVTKKISKLYQRDIVVRDRSRFHHFTPDGCCSCNDFF